MCTIVRKRWIKKGNAIIYREYVSVCVNAITWCLTHSTSWNETLCKWCPWLKEGTQLNFIYWCIKLYFASTWPCLHALTHTNSQVYWWSHKKNRKMCATVGRWAALSQCVKQTTLMRKYAFSWVREETNYSLHSHHSLKYQHSPECFFP